jgi:putative oxidoreductase
MIVATTRHIVTGQGTPAHAFKNAWVFLGILFVGPGRYSVDDWWRRRRTP